jgi:exopolyphosphatase/guanosine-5'-triphosphate,3'-diphosphate pyrophosphatase
MVDRGVELGGWHRGRFAHVFAAIDLGTNNCRLLVARASMSGFDVIDAFSRPVRLGEGIGASGALCSEAIERTIEALSVCAGKIRRNNVTRARHIATEACRRAGNGLAFIEQVQARTGLCFEVIPPNEEARLAVTGCEPLIDPAIPRALLVDIGGGSTEVTWMSVMPTGDAPCGMRVRILDVISIPWGVVTLSEAVTRGLPREVPVPQEAYEAMIARIVDALQPFDRRHAISTQVGAGLVQMIGASGTVTTVAALHLGLKRYVRSSVDGTSVPREAIRRINAELSARSIGALAELPCIGPERADLAPAGGAILEAVCRLWPVETVAVADRSLREGVLLDLMRQADREACAS